MSSSTPARMEHSENGPSSANRWMACPGSINQARRVPAIVKESQQTVYAAEGSAAHGLAEKVLRDGLDPQVVLGHFITPEGKILTPADARPLRESKGAWIFEITEEMVEAVLVYRQTVREVMAALEGAELFVEQRVYPLPEDKTVFGTADAIVHQPFGRLVVIDFKYGKGIEVDVEGNDQLQMYGLGALERIGDDASVSDVVVVVVQPRVRGGDFEPKVWKTTPEELRAFQDVCVSAVEATRRPDAPLIPGPHCRPFCPARGICPALRQLVLDEVFAEYAETGTPELRTTDADAIAQIERNMDILPLVQAWLKEQPVLAQRAIERGAMVRGWKVVASVTRRKYRDEAEVIYALREEGIQPTIYEDKPSLKSPAQLERVMGKNWVAQFTYNPEGAPTLAPESDKRPALPPTVERDFDPDDVP